MGASLELGAAGSSLARVSRHSGSAFPAGLGLGDSSLNPRWDETPLLPREQSEGMFQPRRGNLPGVEMLESPHRLGILASIHVFIFRPAIFPPNTRDSIQEEIITPRNRILRVLPETIPTVHPWRTSRLPASDIPESPLGFSFSPEGLGHPC